MRRTVCFLLFLSSACGAACDRPTGLWLVHLVEHPDGTCGAMQDELVELVPAPGHESADCGAPTFVWADDSCSFDARFRCAAGGNTSDQLLSLTHETDDIWTGTGDVHATAASGASCHSVYDVQASRR